MILIDKLFGKNYDVDQLYCPFVIVRSSNFDILYTPPEVRCPEHRSSTIRWQSSMLNAVPHL